MTGLAIGAVFEVAGIGTGVGCGCLAGFENIESLPQRFEVMEADVGAIKAFIAAHTGL